MQKNMPKSTAAPIVQLVVIALVGVWILVTEPVTFPTGAVQVAQADNTPTNVVRP